MDDADRAALRIEEFDRRALEAQKEQSKPRFVALNIEGVLSCPECLEPLLEHRVAAGICVECLTDIEHREGRG